MSTVLALVGTDHHQFNRLVDWLDEAAVRNPHVRFVVQHGASRAPLVADAHDYLPYEEIHRLVREADVVVCHGGPGTIMDARGAGHVPICVPRDPGLGEHVDSHQQRFAAVMHDEGMVVTCTTAAAFQVALAERLTAGKVPGPEGLDDATLAARHRITLALDELVDEAERNRQRRRVLGLFRRTADPQ
jgi:UDP-N-acetylglucosamine transferase subunit ALG13